MQIRLSCTRRRFDPNEGSRPPSEGISQPPLVSPGSDCDPPQIEAAAAPPFLSLKESADWLCVSLSTLKRMLAKGDLGTVRVGKRRKIPASYLAAYVTKDILLPDDVIDVE